MSFAYRLLRILVYPFYKIFFGLRMVGRKNEPTTGPCLICANHLSMHDICFLGLTLKRQIYFVAKAEVIKVRPVAWFMRKFGVIGVKRGEANIASIQQTIHTLEEGKYIGIFPQGTRRRDVEPETTEIKSGVGMIACRAHCDVLPVRISTKGNHVKFFRRVTVTVGTPISYEELGFEKGNKAEYDAAAALIFSRICALGKDETK